MYASFTEDQLQFKDVVARFLTDKSPPEAVRQLMVSSEGFDRDVWRQLSQEVGLAGTHLPEAYGGFGYGAVELGIISEQMGRHLYCGPFFSSAVMAGSALVDLASEEHKERLLPSIANGSKIATLVLDDVDDMQAVGDKLTHKNGAISGVAQLVVDAHIADILIVIATGRAGLSVFEVDPSTVEIQARKVMDPTRKLSKIIFQQSPAVQLGAFDVSQLARLWDQLSTMLAHEMLGGAQRLFETTIEYMKMRVQFGRAIGSFQSLKHRCADLLLELEFAKAMTHEAARYLATGDGDVYSPNMAKFLAGDAFMNIAKQAIQLRGGIGFTWEEDTHLWFKRAKSSEVFLGTSNWHRERMMQRIEEAASA